MSIATALDEAIIAAGVPRAAFSGVVIGYAGTRENPLPPADPTDKTRWLVRFTDEATDEQKAAAAAAIKAFDPASVKEPRVVDFETMQERLTDAEWQALQAACAADVPLARQYERAKTRGTLNLNDPEVATAFAGLVRAGLFTYARLAELAGVDSLP